MSEFKLANWMGDLREKIGDVDLRYLKMPGTHNSGSFSYDLLGRVRCQECGIGSQLNLGVRNFDIRLTCEDGKFYMHHNGCFDEFQFFINAVEEIAEFCQCHPSEFIRINLSGQNGSNIQNNGELLRKLYEVLRVLSPWVIHNTSKNQELYNNKFSLNQVVREEDHSTNQILLKQSGDEHIKGLDKWDSEGLIFGPGGISSTWDGYMTGEDPDYILMRMPGEILRGLNNRTPNHKSFYSLDWYMFAGMSAGSTTKAIFGDSKEGIRHWAELAHRNYHLFVRRFNAYQLKNCNYITFDYINASLAKSVVRLNLCCKGLSDFTGEESASERPEIACRLYEHNDYGGRCWEMTSGCHNYGEFLQHSFNDIASSVRVTPGYAAFFFKDQNFMSEKLVLHEDCNNLGGHGKNDNISSVMMLPTMAIDRIQPIPKAKPCYFYIRDLKHHQLLDAGWAHDDSNAHHDGCDGLDNAKWCFEELPHGKLDDLETTYYRMYNKMHHTYLRAGETADNYVYCSKGPDDMSLLEENMMWRIVPAGTQDGMTYYRIMDGMHDLALVSGWIYDRSVYHQKYTNLSHTHWFIEPVPGESDPADYPEFLK